MANVPTDRKSESEEVLAKKLQDAAGQVPAGALYSYYEHPDPEFSYEVLGYIIDRASNEVLVVYQAYQYRECIPYALALRIWLETVEWEGKTVQRFTRLTNRPSMVESEPQIL